MSVYKGTQLIAANGAPGRNGADGRNGTNGQGIMIRNAFVELHNNINDNGRIEMTNYGDGTWCSVGGYDCRVAQGQGTIVYGFRCTGSGSGTATFGYNNSLTSTAPGVTLEGWENTATLVGEGVHIEGHENNISNVNPGVHIEGYGHDFSTRRIPLSDGGHLGGYGLTSSNVNSNFIKSHQRGDYESDNIEAIGIKKGTSGQLGRLMRNDGCVGISGDLTFTAVDEHGNDIGRYTLGEIVQALITAGILPGPNASNT